MAKPTDEALTKSIQATELIGASLTVDQLSVILPGTNSTTTPQNQTQTKTTTTTAAATLHQDTILQDNSASAAVTDLENSSTENELISCVQKYPPEIFSVAAEISSSLQENINSLPTTASSSPTSTLSTLSSSSSPTSITSSLLRKSSSNEINDNIIVAAPEAIAQRITSTDTVVSDLVKATTQANKEKKLANPKSSISDSSSMKLSEIGMNPAIVHVNKHTMSSDELQQQSEIPVSAVAASPEAAMMTNGKEDAVEPEKSLREENLNINYKINTLNGSLDKNLNNINSSNSSSSNIINNNNNNNLSTSKKTSSVDETDRSVAAAQTAVNTPVSKSLTDKPTIDLINNNSNSKVTTAATAKTTTTEPTETTNSSSNQLVNDSNINNNNKSAKTPELPADVTASATLNGEGEIVESGAGATDDSSSSKKEEIVAPGKAKPTPEQSAAIQAAIQSLINYNEGQWSPQNPTGKKQYNRDQLMQLREAKASRQTPNVGTINASILPDSQSSQPNLMPSFVRGNNNKRVQSMGGIGSMGDRTGMAMSGGGVMGGTGYNNKQASMSGVIQRNSNKGSIKGGVFRINLSLNQDVKLNETDNAWRPRRLNPESGEGMHDSEELKRRVRGILNKLTPEKFDTLVEQIIKLKIDTNEKVNDVMELVFEKAIDEPNFSVSYARLCQRLVEEVKARDTMESDTRANLKQFRNSLLDKTENEFNENVARRAAKESKLQPILDKIRDCKDPVEKLELQAQLEEEERKIRRRSGGTVRFIGELFKISMLTGKIINSCIDLLLKAKSEDQLESLCKLLTTVGEQFEKTPQNIREPNVFYNLDNTMKTMQAIVTKTDKEAVGAKVTSRVRFMLQDVIDLRTRKWVSTRGDTPKTMEEIQKQTKTEQMSTQYMNYSSMMSSGGGGGSSGGGGGGGSMKKDDRRFNDRGNNSYGNNRDGSRGGRNDDGGSMRRSQNQAGGNSMGGNGNNSNNSDDTWHHVQPGKGNRSIGAVDTNKLEPMLNDLDMGTKKMGGLQQFLWNSSGGQSRVQSNASNSFAALSTLIDPKSSNDRNDRNDRGGPRNKNSYSKNSMERDRYDRSVHSHGGSAHGSRESSSSRNQPGRGMMNASNMQKSASHNKNQSNYQSMVPRMQAKMGLPTSSSSHLQLSSNITSTTTASAAISNTSSSAAAAAVDYETPTAAPPAVFEEPTKEEETAMKSAISDMVEAAANAKTLNAVIPSLTIFKESLRSYFLFMILSEYLHLVNVGQVQRRYAANIVAFFFKRNYMNIRHLRLAYKQLCEFVCDIILDVPDFWTYIMEFAGPLMTNKMITINDLWNKDLAAQKQGPIFLKSFLTYCTREIGPDFTRATWKSSKLNWTDFMPESDVANFIKTNKVEFLEDESVKPHIFVTEDRAKLNEKIVERVDHLLKDKASVESIIDYINGNVTEMDKTLTRSLTTSICNYAIAFKDGTFKLDLTTFQKTCIPIMTRLLDSKEQLELEALLAMQLLCNRLEHPRGLLSELFGELFETEVIQQEVYIKWRDSEEESLAGKGVAVKGLNQFFNQLLSGETSDEAN